MAGMIKYLQSFRFKGLTVILGVFLAISVVLWTERSGIQYQAEIKKNSGSFPLLLRKWQKLDRLI